MLLSFLGFSLLVSLTVAIGPLDPQQIHISLGTNETEMVVTWVTMKNLNGHHGHVLFGLSETHLINDVRAEASSFHTHFVTHRALLADLKPATKYYYKVGSNGTSYTKLFSFKTIPSGNKWLPRLALYGDLGFQNERSLPFLKKEVEKEMIDAIFHVGDFAYDLNERNCEQGHDFMRSIEPVAANVPYMTIPGNHENAENFSHYDARFSMIGDRHDPNHKESLTKRLNNHFWSADVGPIHFVMFSTEFYYYTNYGWDQIERQFRFLEEDLKRANLNREERPWIIAMGHRPLYCLKVGDYSCDLATLERPEIRQGIHMHNDKTKPRQYGLEKLFFKYGVDIQMYGHEHFYGRLLPVYNYDLMNGTNKSNPYDHPSGPMHITTGSAGNRENHPPFNEHLKNFVAFHAFDYGYTRIIFKDLNHIHIEQVSDDKHGQVIDHIEIIKHDVHPKWMNKM